MQRHCICARVVHPRPSTRHSEVRLVPEPQALPTTCQGLRVQWLLGQVSTPDRSRGNSRWGQSLAPVAIRETTLWRAASTSLSRQARRNKEWELGAQWLPNQTVMPQDSPRCSHPSSSLFHRSARPEEAPGRARSPDRCHRHLSCTSAPTRLRSTMIRSLRQARHRQTTRHAATSTRQALEETRIRP